MNYKYRRGQIFGKRLKVPKDILSKVYASALFFREYIEYDLEDKIPISCIIEQDREIVERFGIEKCKTLDWELLSKRPYRFEINIRNLLMEIDPQTEDINAALYERVKDVLRPADYSDRMKEAYPDRLLDMTGADDVRYDIIYRFNRGDVTLEELVDNWELFRNKDVSVCLLRDDRNESRINGSDLKVFMQEFGNLAPIIAKYNNIYTFINEVKSLEGEEKREYVKSITDSILANTRREYGDYRPVIELEDDEYKEIFKYSSLEDFLKLFNSYYTEAIIRELETLPQDYIFNMSIPFSVLLNYHVLSFIGTFGLKNVEDFNTECGYFFSKNDCEMLKLMDDMYLHYAGNEWDPQKNIYTKPTLDENGEYIDRPYTKEEFYEAMRRMIVYGPSDWNFADKAPDYRDMTGEFRQRFSELFISEQAPEELQKLFYTKSIIPQILLEHPEYVDFLDGKDLGSCFKGVNIKVKGSKALYEYENLYRFLSTKTDFHSVIDLVTQYGDLFDIVFDRTRADGYSYEINFDINDDLDKFQDRINETFKRLVIEKGVKYPKTIPRSLRENYPEMFLSENAPQELQDAFYSRSFASEMILDHPEYREFLKDIDLEILYKNMPVRMADNTFETINLIKAMIQTCGKDETLDLMISYGKYIEAVFDANKLTEFRYNKEFTKDDLLDEMDKSILQAIIDGKIKYGEDMPDHFKEKNPSMFLGKDVPEEIKKKFYNREFTIEDFINNPELLDVFENTNIACGFSETVSWMIPLFGDNEDIKEANNNRLKVLSAYSKIQDVSLQKAFEEYVRECGDKIDLEKIEYVSDVLSKLSLSNSSEIYTFRKELATQILNSPNPIETLNEIEDIFLRNTIPTFGKIYSCFEILHPDFKGFNFESTNISPVLKNSTNEQKSKIIFADLIKASFGSNNRSVRNFLDNIEKGNALYENIKTGQIRFEDLSEAQRQDLTSFSKILSTIYNMNLQKGKEEPFINTENPITDISKLSKLLSKDGTLDYDLR